MAVPPRYRRLYGGTCPAGCGGSSPSAEDVDAAGRPAGRLGQAADLQRHAASAALAAQAWLQLGQRLALHALSDPGCRVDHRLTAAAADSPEARPRDQGLAELQLCISNWGGPAGIGH